MTMRRILVSMFAVCLALSGVAVSAGELALFAPTCDTTQVEAELPRAEDGLFEIGWQAKNACTDQCAANFIQCLDDCDAWPYSGCYNDCRSMRTQCYLGCF